MGRWQAAQFSNRMGAMSLLNVTAVAGADEARGSGAGVRSQADSVSNTTPNPNEASLVGSWELGVGN